MKSHIIVASLILVTVCLIFFTSEKENSSQIFAEWKQEYSKQYNSVEQFYRYRIFIETLTSVNQHNKRAEEGLQSFTLALNSFSDLADEQFEQIYMSKKQPQTSNFACSNEQPPTTDIPDAFDWSAKSAVTSVRHISKCISGYAVAAAEAVEANNYITTRQIKTFSPQQIVDCSKTEGNSGCKSGSVLNAFEYLIKNGISLESSYPYTDSQTTCSYKMAMKAWEVIGCVKVTPQKEALIKAAVYHHPLAVSINAGTSHMKSYNSGVFESSLIYPCKTNPTHWMLMIGYGKDTSSKTNYWKLKNSWGTSWGQQGYLYILRKGDGEGECGVQAQLYYPK